MRSYLLIVLAGCTSAQAQETPSVPRVLLDRRLNETVVQLTGVNDKTVMYLDHTGQARTDLITDYLAILPAPDVPALEHPISLVELLDGQRIVGRLLPERTPPEDSLLWEHAGLGVLTFRLEDVRTIQLQGGPETPPRSDEAADIVMLVNGDRLDGFVNSLGPMVSMDVGESSREIPPDRIQTVLLSGGKPKPPPRGVVAWISDGSVLACRAIQTARTGEVIITPRLAAADSAEPSTEAPDPPAKTLSMRLRDVRAVAVDQSILAPLASLTIAAQTPGPGRRWSRDVQVTEPRWAPIGLADVELPGPMTVEWDLPSAAAKFAAEVELPRQMWTWGDCEVVVSVLTAGGETELWRRRINAESPRSRVMTSLPVGSTRLKVQMNAGEFGAVQDKVLLRRGVITLAP